MDSPEPRIRDIRVYRPSFVGMALLACAPFLAFAAAPVYGVVGTVVLAAVWLVLFTFGCRWFMRYPRRLPMLGAASLLSWLVVVLMSR